MIAEKVFVTEYITFLTMSSVDLLIDIDLNK